jgi:Co/Zn/Cd efflux system component
VIANLGVIGADLLVWLTSARWPDYVIGLIITAFVLLGGLEIIRDAAPSYEPGLEQDEQAQTGVNLGCSPLAGVANSIARQVTFAHKHRALPSI